MKIALCQILKFPSFLREVSDDKLEIQTAYKIFKLNKSVEEHIRFYDENLKKIIDTYAMYDEQGQLKRDEKNGILISKDNIDICTKKIQELNECLVDIPEIYFYINEFDGIKLSLEALEPIFPLIVE